MTTSAPPYLRSALLQREAAEMLGVTPKTLRAWLHSGYGPQPVRDGSRLLYDRAELSAFLAGAR